MTRQMTRQTTRLAAATLALALVASVAACTSGSGTTAESTAGTMAGSAAGTATGASQGSASPRPAPLTVDTSSGRLHGVATATAREFLGVRYGQAPTGSRRWTMPVDAAKAAGTVSATKAGPTCAQAGVAPGAAATSSTSEDCLFLNVTTPARIDPAEKLPVMVWWHGGGYTSGAGSSYDAQRLADRGHVMVVTVNYRLGVFGYLSLPGLAGSGNFGLADQILATRWAKRNAAAFGGDPENVTVFGESAGAMSACALLTSPAATGLVDKVAMSSGSCELSWPQDGLFPGAPPQTPYAPLAVGEQLGTSQAKTLGCSGTAALTCLRGKPTKDLLKIFPNFSDVLAYGTPLLPDDPATALRQGKAARIPVLSGGNHDEERAFVGGVQKAKPVFTAATYPTFLRSAFGANAAAVAKEYPLTAYPSAADAWATVITDASWACPTLRGNAGLADGGATVHAYEFDDPSAPDVNMVASEQFAPKAAHATDVPYLFDLMGKNLLRTPAQKKLANQMIDYWTSFARTGTPKADGAPSWPTLTDATGPTLQLNPTTIATVDVAAEHHCDFWATPRF